MTDETDQEHLPSYEDLRYLHDEYDVPLGTLARLRGISRQRIHEYFNHHGWTHRTGHQRFLRRERIVRRLIVEYGCRQSDVAKLMGMTAQHLHQLLARHDTLVDSTERAAGDKLPLKKRRLIFKAYTGEGLTQNEVAYLAGVAQNTVSRIYIKYKDGLEDEEE